MSERFDFVLDGAPASVSAEPRSPALAALREQCGVPGLKAGCSPQGLCGCCTVLVDGKPRLTCTLPVKSIAGKDLRTLASVPEADQRRLADAFATTHAAQCGYCTPGIALSASTLLAAGRQATDEEIQRTLAPHTCRCTGYTSIRAAIGLATDPGVSPVRPATAAEADTVLGRRVFVDDLVPPDLLHGAVVLAPGGDMQFDGADVAAASSASGVRAVVVLAKGGERIEAGGRLLVAVAADTRAEARAAAALVQLHTSPLAPEAAGTRLSRTFAQGDLAAAFAAATHVTRIERRFASTDAAPLEPEAALALVDGDDTLVVYSGCDDAGATAQAVAEDVGRPAVVRQLPNGGSYGSRVSAAVECAAARLTLATGRPVRLALEHIEGTATRHRRPAAVVEGELAADAGGVVLALRLAVRFEGGPRTHDVERLAAEALGALAYAVPAVELTLEVTSGPGAPTAPLRGAGAAPVCAMVEALLDAHAARIGVDPRSVRDAIVLPELDLLFVLLRAQVPNVAGLPPVRFALARVPGGTGAHVVIDVTAPGEFEVHCNVPEWGQGRDAALVDALATATGLPPSCFEIAWTDSRRVDPGGAGPVAAAARVAGAALVAAGGADAPVGTRVEGRSGAAAAGLAAAAVQLDADGSILRVEVIGAVDDQEPAAARSVVEGAAAMGVGLALSEEVVTTPEGDELRFRYLGTLKAKTTPRLVGSLLSVKGGERDMAEAAAVATSAAVQCAVVAFDGTARDVPMKQSPAAAGVGIRVKGSAPPST